MQRNTPLFYVIRTVILGVFIGLFFAMLTTTKTTAQTAPQIPEPKTELIMVEQSGCHYCIEWKRIIGPIYPKTPEGEFAPIRFTDIHDAPPDGIKYQRKVTFTPTFVLVQNHREIGRIEGYPGEDFFWSLLDMMLTAKTDYSGAG